MAESESSRWMHNGSLTSRVIGAGSEGPPPAGKAVSAPTTISPHGYTLHFLISIIKKSQQLSPSQ
jgi:hypothetical protein